MTSDKDHLELHPDDFDAPPSRRGGDDLKLEAIPTVPDSRMKPSRSTSPFLVAGLFVVVVAAGGYTYWRMTRAEAGPGAVAGPQTTPAPQPTQTASGATAPTGSDASSITVPDRPAAPVPTVPDDVTAPSVERLLAEVRALQQRVADNEQALDEARKASVEEKKARLRAESELTSLHTQMNRVQQAAQRTEEGLRARIAEADRRIAELEGNLGATRRERDGLREDLDKKTEEAAGLGKQLASMTRSRDEALEEAQRARAQARKTSMETQDILKNESEATRQLVSRLEATRREREAETNARRAAEQQVAQLQKDLDALRAQLEEEIRKVEPGELVALTPDMLAPQRTRTVDPRYPSEARNKGITGRVLVRALVSETGEVMRVEVVRSPDDSLSEAASDAVLRFRYRPALKKGVPVKTWVTEAIEFR